MIRSSYLRLLDIYYFYAIYVLEILRFLVEILKWITSLIVDKKTYVKIYNNNDNIIN